MPSLTAEGKEAGRARRAIRTPRAAAVAGLLFSVLLATSLVLVRLAFPDGSETAGEWATDASKRTALLIGLHLVPFAGIAFLWFIGVVRDRVGDAEDRFFATVFLGSGLLFVAMLFSAGAIAGGVVSAAVETGTALAPGGAWSLARRVSLTLTRVYAMRMAAVFAISTTTVAVRLGLEPRWLAAFGYAIAVALLVGVGVVPWLELLFPLWVFVFSVHILVVTFRRSPVAA